MMSFEFQSGNLLNIITEIRQAVQAVYLISPVSSSVQYMQAYFYWFTIHILVCI